MSLHPAAKLASLLALNAAFAATTTTATAQEAHVQVTLEGSRGVVLQERLADTRDLESSWHSLCKSPCETMVTSAPEARHRIVDGMRTRDVVVVGQEGEGRVVRYTSAPAASTPLIVGGIALGVGSIGLGVTGVVKVFESLALNGKCELEGYSYACQTENESKQDRLEMQGLVFMAVAVGLLVLSTVGIALGAAHSSSSVAVSAQRPSVPRPLAKARASAWARPELTPPPNHTTLLELQF